MMQSRRSGIRSTSRVRTQPQVESLEARLTLDASTALGQAVAASVPVDVVDGSLAIRTGPEVDRISVTPTQEFGMLRVVINGRAQGTFGPVSGIDVNSGGGNDSVTIDPRLTLATLIDGGDGNDVLRGGSGANALYGGPGSNVLVGMPGRDILDGGPGRNRILVTKSLGVVQVSPSVPRSALRGLIGSYTIAPLRVAAGPIIVDAAALRNGALNSLVESTYEGGQTVSIANAGSDSAASFTQLLGIPNPAQYTDGGGQYDLVAYRKTIDGSRAIYSTSIVSPRERVATSRAQQLAGNRAADRAVGDDLREIFSPVPSLPPATPAAGGSADLTQIANAYQTSYVFQNDAGAAFQFNNTVYSARSFTNQEDFYLMVQELDVESGSDPYQYVGSNNAIISASDPDKGGGGLLRVNPTVLQPTPQSNPGTTSITTSASATVGGSFGVNESQGLNAQVNASVTIANSETVTVPPTVIQYLGNPANGTPEWAYQFFNQQQPGDAATFINQWIWRVPFSAYPSDTTDIQVEADLFYKTLGDPTQHQFSYISPVPQPFFGTYKLADPVVTGVSTPTVKPGQTFTIKGTGLYPSLVQNVLINGNPLPTTNYKAVSDTEITVVAPNTPGTDLAVTVSTTQNFSTGDVKITIQS